MVLKNSKWDKQAKHKYLKKHGLLKPKDGADNSVSSTPKWSSKKNDGSHAGPDSDGDWSDEEADEELLNEMFPQLGSAELTKEQREKVKHQILADLLEEREREIELQRVEEAEKYNDGIYLGKNPNGGVDDVERKSGASDKEEEEEAEEEREEVPLTLEQFVSRDIFLRSKAARKVPKHKLNENLLEEYGIENYKDTVKQKDDYNDLYNSKQQTRPLSKILTEELVNFRIGQDKLGHSRAAEKAKNIVELDPEESSKYKEIEEKAKLALFLRSLKEKFGAADKPARKNVIEINNIDSSDQRQMENLERRLLKGSTRDQTDDTEIDLDELLGGLSVKSPPASTAEPLEQWLRKNDIDSFLQDLDRESHAKLEPKEAPKLAPPSSSGPQNHAPPPLTDEDFLDDLLG